MLSLVFPIHMELETIAVSCEHAHGQQQEMFEFTT